MDHDLVEQLFKKYYNDVLLYAMSLTRNASEAEDLVSEAFFKALAAVDDVKNFKAWILKVCRNLFLNKKRKHSKIVELSEDISSECDDVLQQIVKDENYRALYNAIGLLPQNLKEVILLFYFEDMRVEAISLIVGKSESNVKVMLYRGREQIKQILEK